MAGSNELLDPRVSQKVQGLKHALHTSGRRAHNWCYVSYVFLKWYKVIVLSRIFFKACSCWNSRWSLQLSHSFTVRTPTFYHLLTKIQLISKRSFEMVWSANHFLPGSHHFLVVAKACFNWLTFNFEWTKVTFCGSSPSHLYPMDFNNHTFRITSNFLWTKAGEMMNRLANVTRHHCNFASCVLEQVSRFF